MDPALEVKDIGPAGAVARLLIQVQGLPAIGQRLEVGPTHAGEHEKVGQQIKKPRAAWRPPAEWHSRIFLLLG
jgi:hypothetical protein